MTDDEFHQTAAQARTLAAARTVDDRLAAAEKSGDHTLAIALKQEKYYRHMQANRSPEGYPQQ
jgi:hypothetical protein